MGSGLLRTGVDALINNLDYHVYHYPHPAWPLCLGNPTLVAGSTWRWGRCLYEMMGKLSNKRRELKCHQRGCKYVRSRDTNLLLLNYEHTRWEKKFKMSTCPKLRSEKPQMQASKLEAKNKLTHTIWRWMEWHAMMDPLRTSKCKNMRI